MSQNFTLQAPDRVRAGDNRYIPTGEDWLYLAVLLDFFKREVIGCSAYSQISLQLAIEALQMTLGHRKPGKRLQQHSDRGSQYVADVYQ